MWGHPIAMEDRGAAARGTGGDGALGDDRSGASTNNAAERERSTIASGGAYRPCGPYRIARLMKIGRARLLSADR
jgi:hypothetical protein